jgi:hypothetical protein
MEDKHLNAIPAEVLTQAQSLISQTIGLLQPYMLALTPSERRGILKMGEKTLSFVEKAHEFVLQNPNLCPPFLDQKAFTVDFNDAHGLLVLHSVALQLYEGIDDTEMVAGSEAYQAALMFYNSVKQAAAHDVPGAKAIYEELHKRFPGGKHRPSGTAD